MTQTQKRIAIVFPADAKAPTAAYVENTRLAGIAQALASAGAHVISAPFCDEMACEVEARLADVDLALVWYNPFESGRDRSGLNAILRSVAAKGVQVSAHPDVIDKIGTKDVLVATRQMSWGTDTRRYASADAMRSELPKLLREGPRVLKQLRGQSGDGVWRVSLKESSPWPLLAVRHAKRGSAEQLLPIEEFLALCSPYFASGGAMIDQPYQDRLSEGMIRCYLVGSHVAGFGEQLINALYPAPMDSSGRPSGEAPEPGPRLYYPSDRPDFQALKHLLESKWIFQMCAALQLNPNELPILWDADFIRGAKSDQGEDSYVLCEINASSIYPFPPSALMPLVNEAVKRCISRL
jgi:hypothetical protein